MSKVLFVLFLAICGIAVAGVDYSIQARTSGAGMGGLGLGGYTETILARYDSQRAEKAAQRRREELRSADARERLPDAPDGWTRRELTEQDFMRFVDRNDPTGGLGGDMGDMALTMAAVSSGGAAVIRREQRESYVYETEGALISLRIAYRNPNNAAGGITGIGTAIVAGNIEAMSGKQGFALVRGVAYREELGLFGMATEEREHRVFSARLGNEVTITVKALAQDEDIIALLDTIDYDTLNEMLSVPVAGIGSAAPDLDPQEAEETVTQRVAAEAQAVIAGGAVAEDRLIAAGETMTSDDASVIEKAGSFLGLLLGRSSGAEEEGSASGADVRVNRSASSAGIATCNTEGGVKRCRIGD